ncbi:MAG: transcriptional repressor [Alphaproteobacteria bacterium]|nr:transcriptional repressor [Alphaproteobacteria bacterium]
MTAHDHASCQHTARSAAERLAAARGVRLTDSRARVLEIVAESHKPVGAYDILQRLAGERGRAAPPTVYRALAFLVDQGFVHRIDSLNAFVACFDPERAHDAGFLICEKCRTVQEVADPALGAAVKSAVAASGFRPRRVVVEISGLCAECAV